LIRTLRKRFFKLQLFSKVPDRSQFFWRNLACPDDFGKAQNKIKTISPYPDQCSESDNIILPISGLYRSHPDLLNFAKKIAMRPGLLKTAVIYYKILFSLK